MYVIMTAATKDGEIVENSQPACTIPEKQGQVYKCVQISELNKAIGTFKSSGY